jgi:hypothetical protein
MKSNSRNLRPGDDRSRAIAQDIEAAVRRLDGDELIPADESLDGDLSNAFLESVEIDDELASRLWAELPPSEVSEDDLTAMARRATERQTSPMPQDAESPQLVSGATRPGDAIMRKLRGPRHPFE